MLRTHFKIPFLLQSMIDAFVFGSYARGTDVLPQSDIDLLVNYKPGSTLF